MDQELAQGFFSATTYHCEAVKKKQKKATSMVKPDLSPRTMASSLADFFNAARSVRRGWGEDDYVKHVVK